MNQHESAICIHMCVWLLLLSIMLLGTVGYFFFSFLCMNSSQFLYSFVSGYLAWFPVKIMLPTHSTWLLVSMSIPLCGVNIQRRQWHPTPVLFAWKIPWMEEPGRLQSMGSLRVRHNWATSLSLFTFMHWRRKWQPTPVFLPGESQGQGSQVGFRLWGCTELDTTVLT